MNDKPVKQKGGAMLNIVFYLQNSTLFFALGWFACYMTKVVV